MDQEIRRFAARTIALAKRVEAGFHFGFGGLCLFGCLWLLTRFGPNIFVLAVDVFLLLFAGSFVLKGCEIYASIQASERPDERQRYFESQSLYIPRPRDHRERQRRERHR